MIVQAYVFGWRALTPLARRAALATLALLVFASLGVAHLRCDKAPEATAYSTFGTRVVVRGGR